MTTMDTVLLVVGLGLIGLALWLLNRSVSRLSAMAGRQALQIAVLERGVDDAKALARKRLVAGRSAR